MILEQTIQDIMEESIDSCFLQFKHTNQVSDEIILFKDFIAFCYASHTQHPDEGIEDVFEDLKESDGDFEISDLMSSAIEIASMRYNDDYYSLQEEAQEVAESNEEDEDEVSELKWDLIDWAKANIKAQINPAKFNELSKIKSDSNGIKKDYYENGNIKSEGKWVNGKGNGLHKGWFENGQLEYECSWNNGVLDGVNKHYYEDGNIKFNASYINGKKNGLHTLKSIEGEIIHEAKWDEGRELFNGKFIPSPFFQLVCQDRIEVYDEGGDVEHPNSSETYYLNALELSMFDSINGLMEQTKMMGWSADVASLIEVGAEWFKQTNPEAHKIFFF